MTDRVVRTIEEDFAGRVPAFNDNAASHYADIVVRRKLQGRPISMADAQIAAISRFPAALLATRNGRDFAHTGINVIDPWQPAAAT